ncbi:MAG: sugar phosphate isomerase/epimerase family protein [Spirochaetaceae bacterium]
MFGVSPAYFISRYGSDFTPDQIVRGLEALVAMGFDAFQLEVFYPERLDEWERSGAAVVGRGAESAGLVPSQFVAHFLLHSFANDAVLSGGGGVEELRRVIGTLEHFPECRTVTLPIPGIEVAGSSYSILYDATVKKLETMLRIAEDAEVRLALEILPYAVIGGSEGFLRLVERLNSPWLGYNFDTGHAWAMKERIELLPEKLAGRIFGTHLCDNDGGINNSWTPGDGTIDWTMVMAALSAGSYHGAFDIEIHCPADQVEASYRRGREHLLARGAQSYQSTRS